MKLTIHLTQYSAVESDVSLQLWESGDARSTDHKKIIPNYGRPF